MDARVYLPAGLVLDTRYRIDAVVGSGGFGVTYRAFDQSLQRPVAVKEYYPDQFASRDGAGSLEIRPSHSKQDAFSWGRDSFLKEARLMARFHHPAIVRVFTVFEEEFWHLRYATRDLATLEAGA